MVKAYVVCVKWRVSNAFWKSFIRYVDVQSKSDPDVTHKVKIMFGDTYSCDCKGYKYSNKCWHITQVKEKKEKQQEKEATIAELERDAKEGNL